MVVNTYHPGASYYRGSYSNWSGQYHCAFYLYLILKSGKNSYYQNFPNFSALLALLSVESCARYSRSRYQLSFKSVLE